MREDLAALTVAIDARERPPQFPERERRVKLMRSLARRLLEAHREWIDEAESQLEADG